MATYVAVIEATEGAPAAAVIRAALVCAVEQLTGSPFDGPIQLKVGEVVEVANRRDQNEQVQGAAR